jgi:WD40 repeat protein
LEPFKSSQTRDKLTNEQRFWKKYETQEVTQLANPLAAISSNNNSANHVLYAFGRTVRLHDTSKGEVIKEISTFGDSVTALCIRPDAAVMAIGLESGIIEVMDTREKFHLRTFRNHRKRINAIDYSENDLYSGGDDFILRHFDVAAGEVVHSYSNAHSDYIKSIKVLEDNHLLSAGYDGFIRLFDFRVHEKAQLEFNHEEQLENIDVFPSGLTFAAVGGNKMSLWDIRAGKELFQAKNNKKIVSGVKVLSQGSRFATVSYDQYLKIYQSDTFELTYMEKLPSPVLCFDTTANNLHFFLGLEGNKLYSKSRKSKALDQETDD